MDFLTEILPWILIILGAVITFAAKPFLLRKAETAEDEDAQEKKIYVTKIIGMWLVIIGAVIIFIAGGSYGR